MSRSDPPVRAVAIGGGHGCARTLAALAPHVGTLVAVVSVADDGGSSGRLRRDLGVVALGDLRAASVALADRSDPAAAALADLAAHRFARGELAGHSLGNLMLLALLDRHGGELVPALDDLGAALGVRGRVLPSTLEPVTLRAQTADGPVTGQARVARTTRIQRVELTPATPAATPEALVAIAEADLVVLGPGSLFTSLLPNLLVPGLAAALAASAARVVLVANLREQPGETQGMALADHLAALDEHVPGLRIDVVLAAADGTLGLDPGAGSGVRTVVVPLAGADGSHDPARLGAALLGLRG